MNCVFCRIVGGEIPFYRIAETEDALVFLDIMPLTRGHMLVIPKQHLALAHEADSSLMGHLMALAVHIAGAVQPVLGCDGFNFLVNSGARAGQVVAHVHLHLIPRYEGDAISWPWPQGTLTDQEAAELVRLITERLG